jgi:hypothetical protein
MSALAAGNVPSLQDGGHFYSSMVLQSILCTAIIQAIYLIWLLTLPVVTSLDIGFRVWFIFLGVTFFARLMIVFLCYTAFIFQCEYLCHQIHLFDECQSGMVEIKECMKMHSAISDEMQHGLDEWSGFLVAAICIPILVIVFQVCMVFEELLTFSGDYFFLVYELHYFVLTWSMIRHAANVSSKWSEVSRNQWQKVVSGEVVYCTNGAHDQNLTQVFVVGLFHPRHLKMLGVSITVRFMQRLGYVLLVALIYSIEYIPW